MIRKLFLVSDYSDKFDEFVSRFVDVSGGENAKIVFLMQGGKDWEEPYELYKKSFQKSALIDFYPIFPDDEDEFKSEMVKKLKEASGIFVGGGYTFRYIRAYAESELTKIIVKKYQSGIPYAGLSAGAIITLRLGILDKILLKPHFSQQNRFFELQKKLRKSKAKFGLGLDDGIWLEIENEVNGTVFGKGNCYRCNKIEDEEFEFKIFHPGDNIDLSVEEE